MNLRKPTHFLFMIICATSLTACSTTKQWNYGGGDPKERGLELSYEYDRFQQPEVNEVQGARLANSVCAERGYFGANPIGSELSNCIEVYGFWCQTYRVTRKYQCFGSAR